MSREEVLLLKSYYEARGGLPLGYAFLCIIGIFFGLLMRKFDEVSARLSFSPKYCRAVAENAIKPLVFMYYEAISIFLGSKNVILG